MMKSIYIAGPMSGYPEFNFPAFNQAAKVWESIGVVVYNPAAKDAEGQIDAEAFATGDHVKANAAGFDFREAYLWDIECVLKAESIYMLKGWEKSPGACGEHAVAVAMQRHYPEYEIIYQN